MNIKHLAGHHNQKTHGKVSDAKKAFYKKYQLNSEDVANLNHLNGMVWQNTYGVEDVVEAFNKSGLPVYRFIIDEDYDRSTPSSSMNNDTYLNFGTEDDPEYFSLTITGQANKAYPSVGIHYAENMRGKEFIDFMLDDGSKQLDLIESILRDTGKFQNVYIADEVPAMLLADKGYRTSEIEDFRIRAAYDYLERKYSLRVPVGPLPNTKDILISDLLKIPHPYYPDVPLFEELLLNEHPEETMSVSAYKQL